MKLATIAAERLLPGGVGLGLIYIAARTLELSRGIDVPFGLGVALFALGLGAWIYAVRSDEPTGRPF